MKGACACLPIPWRASGRPRCDLDPDYRLYTLIGRPVPRGCLVEACALARAFAPGEAKQSLWVFGGSVRTRQGFRSRGGQTVILIGSLSPLEVAWNSHGNHRPISARGRNRAHGTSFRSHAYGAFARSSPPACAPPQQLVGVLIDAEAWHQLVRYVGQLELEVERAENSEVRAIIEARLPGAMFEPGSPALVEEIEHEYEHIISENLRSQA
jgi:hypothetical protein